VTSDQRLEEIRSRLEKAFEPELLVVEDEGHLHVGHEGAKDGRGHFRINIVTSKFNDKSMIARHRAIYQEMGSLMETDIHALAIEAYASDDV
jgi:stress-induced morphogen